MIILALISGSLIAFVLQRPVARFAVRIGAVSRVREDRWQHPQSLSRLAGLSFALPLLIAAAAFQQFSLALTLSMVIALGVLDDARELSPLPKFLGQIVALIPFVLGNVAFGSQTLVMFWLLVHLNATNMFDNMDGSLGVVGSVSLLTYGGLLVRADPTLAALSFMLAGGLIVFLKENWHPAKAFMGDTGSMVVGLVLGLCSLELMSVTNNVFKATLPSCLILLDSIRVCITRLATHTPIWIGGLDHLTHRLARRGYAPQRIALTFAIITMLCSAAALAIE
jgi:UDP-GlcNAc:undecaprenyl-phosphate/decaprenyl-phosphate GlcNAc-1-phosphate transferase